MKAVSQFYTFFWMIYFPTCIAFNGVTSSMKYADEILTVVLIVYTLFNSHRRFTVKYPLKEYKIFLVILALYVAYSLVLGVNVSISVWRDLVQWIRPFSVIYCTWILNPQFSKKQKKIMLSSMIITHVAWIIYHPETVDLTRQSEFVVLGQMAMCLGMTWYLFNEESKKNAYIAMMLVVSGLLAPKFKFLGEVVCFVYMMFFLKKKLNFKSMKTIVPLSIMVAVILYVTWYKFDAYYISGFSASGANRMARPETYKTSLVILKDYFPFGPGMGTFGVAAAADYYSPLYYKYNLSNIWGLSRSNPMFLADAFYPTLCQFGVVGIILFIVFWKRRLLDLNNIADLRYYRVAWISFFCLAIEQTADSSFLSGKGMGYCMLIALCLNANRNTKPMVDLQKSTSINSPICDSSNTDVANSSLNV